MPVWSCFGCGRWRGTGAAVRRVIVVSRAIVVSSLVIVGVPWLVFSFCSVSSYLAGRVGMVGWRW